MSKDPSVKWHHHPANASQLDLLADIIRYQADKINRPHIEPRAVQWPSWAAPREIPPVERCSTVVDFAWAMAKVVADAAFFGRATDRPRGPRTYAVHWRDHDTGTEHVANNGELMTLEEAIAATRLFADGWVVDHEFLDRDGPSGAAVSRSATTAAATLSLAAMDQSRDICADCGTVVGELGDCQCDDEPLEITPVSLTGTLDRIHAAITQDEGVAG